MITTHTIRSFNAATTRPSIHVLAIASRSQTRRTLPRLLPAHAHVQFTPFSSSASLRSKPKKPSRSSSTSTAPKFRVPSNVTQTVSHAEAERTQHRLAFLSQGTADSHASVNPVPTTRPAPLDRPEKPASPGIGYYFSLGKAYVSFYKTGLKNVWANWQLMRMLNDAHGDVARNLPPVPIPIPTTGDLLNAALLPVSAVPRAAHIANKQGWASGLKFLRAERERCKGELEASVRWRARAREIHIIALQRFTRAEMQLLRRTYRDVWRLIPFLAVLVVCGEFTPLVVAMGVVKPPETCVLAWQREKAREKRARAKDEWCARLGKGAGKGLVNMVVPPQKVMDVIKGANEAEVKAFCEVLGQKVRFWDDGKSKLMEYMRYLLLDDALIIKGGGVQRMLREEVEMAVLERGGVEVGLGLGPKGAERDQRWWLERWVEGSKKVDIY